VQEHGSLEEPAMTGAIKKCNIREKDQIHDVEEISSVWRKQTKIYMGFDQMSKYRIQTISKRTHKQLKQFIPN
jgi:hypothetical protein